MLNWRHLVRLSDADLAQFDIAAVNLACTESLPEAEQVNESFCLAKLDEWAEAIHRYTNQLMPQFKRKPHEYENSEAYFRTLCLITMLQRDKGVRYNLAKRDEKVPLDTADTFIHGIIQGDGGTCASMPVLYAAIGRRLSYPLKLASTRGKVFTHLFTRWDDPKTGERFNIEATNKGLFTPTDDYYRNDPHHKLYDLAPEVEAAGHYLKSQTPRMELAGFLGSRAWRFQDVKDWWRCVDAWAWAATLFPQNEYIRNSLKRCMVEWDKEQDRRKPVGFPQVWVRGRGRFFSDDLPLDLEQNICALTAIHNMLNDPRLEAKYWGPMRRGDYSRFPKRVLATFAPDMSFHIDMEVS